MSDISLVLENVGLSSEEQLTMECPPASFNYMESNLKPQSREVTEKVITPEILKKINNLYQLVGHHDNLIENTKITMSIAQEMLELVPDAYAFEARKCTVYPSNNNVANIADILNRQINRDKESLLEPAKDALEHMLDKLRLIKDTEILDDLFQETKAFVDLNKDKIKEFLDKPHNVYTKANAFVRVDTEPLATLNLIVNEIVNWDEGAGLFVSIVNLLKTEEYSDMVYFVTAGATYVSFKTIFTNLNMLSDSKEYEAAKARAELDVDRVYVQQDDNLTAVRKGDVTVKQLDTIFLTHDAYSEYIDVVLSLMNKDKSMLFFKALQQAIDILN